MQNGATILPHLYQAFSEKMSASAAEWGVNTFFDGCVDAENAVISEGIHAVPFRLGEIKTAESLGSLVKKPRPLPQGWTIGRINPDILKDLVVNAIHHQSDHVKSAAWPRRPQPECVIDPPSASMCSTVHAESASKCARKLLAWILDRHLLEFGRRNALRAVDGSERLRGKSGNGGGVEDALRILIAGSYIQQCPSPPSAYACKRPSPWYLVNPALYDDHTRQYPT
jgi:hypothetical protein